LVHCQILMNFIFVSYVASYIHVSMKKVLFIMDLYGFVTIYGFLLNYIKLIIILIHNILIKSNNKIYTKNGILDGMIKI
jgi:hypothetical protein